MASKRERRKVRKKQLRINTKLKKQLFGHLALSPCCYCKKVFFVEQLTIEHLFPLSLGGSNDPTNIDLACPPCNQEKGREVWLSKHHNYKKLIERYSTTVIIELQEETL